MRVRSLSQEDPLKKEMATRSSILACEVPLTEKPSGLSSMGSQSVGHNFVTKQHQPIPVVSQDITDVPGWAICGGGGGAERLRGGHSLLLGVLSCLWALVPSLIFLRDH